MRLKSISCYSVIFGGVIGYSGDDINKFLWMVRIAEGEHPKIVKNIIKINFTFFRFERAIISRSLANTVWVCTPRRLCLIRSCTKCPIIGSVNYG